MSVSDPWRSAEEAAQFLGLKEQTLATWRCNKRYKLPFSRAGRRIRYKQSDLEKFLELRTVGAFDAE